jgi:two-component system, sensor histidine kinase and response regulator
MNPEPIKLLLVDDVVENLTALAALLRRDGLEIFQARSGPEALELLLVHDFALAILDVQMPEMDGFELAELMRGTARTKHVPIIFVTAGSRDPQRVFKGYESGAVDFLFKPVEPRVLEGKAEVFFELHRQRKELQTLLGLNEIFVGILGHDLRNPLSTILTGSMLLEKQLADEGQLTTVRRMASAGRRMSGMIEQLLDLTRARLGGGIGFVRGRETFDVAQLVQRVVDELRGAHPHREVVIRVVGSTACVGDADRLLQVLSNLIGNALQHDDSGGAVSVIVDAGSDDVFVRVRNSGAIPAEILPRIFDPFRGHQRSASRTHGLGLGLYISQQIASAHGGAVTVVSDDRTGTEFTLRLPCGGVSSTTHRAAGSASPVLVVDDDQDIRESLREVLEDAGYAVVTASNGQEALDVLGRSPRPSVVILDLMLPVLDGARVYATMQADPQLAAIPVIMSTAVPSLAPEHVTVLAKPLRLERLLAMVAELTRRS